MKKYAIFLPLLLLVFSCSQDDQSGYLGEQELINTEIENRNSSSGPCSITFLGYDENGCCIYRLNYISLPPGGGDDTRAGTTSQTGKLRYYITVNGERIRGNVFTVCDTATVRLIKGGRDFSILVCSSVVTCDRDCGVDVTIEEIENERQCCWTVTTSGATNQTLIIDGNPQNLSGDVQQMICAAPGETIEVQLVNKAGVVCFEDSVKCYDCEDCDNLELTVELVPSAPQNGMNCCWAHMKINTSYPCDSGSSTTGFMPSPLPSGVVEAGGSGTIVSHSALFCYEDDADTALTGFWEVLESTTTGELLCPRMEVDFDLADCQ